MHKGKQKFEVKEMYLTKLLSTKVIVQDSFWGRLGGMFDLAEIGVEIMQT